MSSQPDKTIEALLLEKRQFPPRKSFQEQANVRDPSIYRKADRDFEKFWAGSAREHTWYKPWKRVLEWKPPKAKQLLGGKLNASANCIDRHGLVARKTKAALISEGAPCEHRRLTYRTPLRH